MKTYYLPMTAIFIALLIVGKMDADEEKAHQVARAQNLKVQRTERLNEAEKSLRYMTSYDRMVVK